LLSLHPLDVLAAIRQLGARIDEVSVRALLQEDGGVLDLLQNDGSPVRQIALTEKQIKGMLAASKDMDVITDNAPEDIDKLSAETTEKLDAVARRNGLASYDEYKVIGENIGLVFGGFDTGSEPAQRLKPSGMFAKGMTPARQRVIIPSPCDRREQQE
jgi:hypothetical protein